MGKKVYAIKKTMTKKGKKIHVFITDSHSEVLETSDKDMAEKLCEVMRANSDSGWDYEVITIGKS